MKTRSGLEGSHRGKGPLKRPRVVLQEDSSEPESSSNSETDKNGDPDSDIGQKPSTPEQEREQIRKASPHPDDLPDLELSDTESQPRSDQVRRSTGKKRKNRITSDSDTEPPGDVSGPEESQRTPSNPVKVPVRQKKKKKRKCQRQQQRDSSDSEPEPAEPESPGGVSIPEEPRGSPRNEVNNQSPPPRKSARIRTRKNKPFHKPTRQEVFDGIPESAGRPRRPIRMKAAAAFTRETHFYNRDNLSESETSSVDEVVKGKYTKEIPVEEVQERDIEEVSQEHDHRRINLANERQHWDEDMEYLEHLRAELERRHHTTTEESAVSSGDDDLQPLPPEAYRPDDDDDIAQDPVVNAPPNLPAVPMPVQQVPFISADDEEDDSMYGVDDAHVNRPMANRVNFGFGAAAIETDEELEALMLAMDDTAPVDPADMVDGRRVPAGNVDKQVSEDEGSIIIVSDSDGEEDLSIPVQAPNRSVHDNQAAGPARSDIDEMLAIPSCSKNYSGPAQSIRESSHQESHNRRQVSFSIEPVEGGNLQDDRQEVTDNQRNATAEKAVQVPEVEDEEMPEEPSHGFMQVQDRGDHCYGKIAQGDGDGMDAVPDERLTPKMVGDDVYNKTPVQGQASLNSSSLSDHSASHAGSGFTGHVPMDVEEGTAPERTSTAASMSSQIPFRRRLFTSTPENEILTTTSPQQKENTGAGNLEKISSQSSYISESLESEDRNLGENGESEDTDNDALSMEITPVRRKSFRRVVSEDEEEEPAPSDKPDYSRPPVIESDDETEDDRNEGSADSDQNSDTEGNEEEGSTSRSGSEDDDDDVARRRADSDSDEDDDGRRRSKRAQLVTPQKRQYLENMERYRMLREKKNSK